MDFQFNSPVHKIEDASFTDKKIELYLKRDDLIHPLISGNKWRKLKFLLADARLQHKTHLVTFGGAFSNHLLATAAAGATFGFKTTGFVRGEKVTNDTLFMCSLLGMHLIFTDRNSYQHKQELFSSNFANLPEAFFIDEGGASAQAALGCSELVTELPEDFDHLFCACGTGTTAAGILNGLTAKNLSTQFHAVPVFKNAGWMRLEIEKYLLKEASFNLHSQYGFGGYAKTTPDLLFFIKKFIAATGILIDPVYTGKMLFAVYDLINKNYFLPGSKILAVHTGGIFGLLGMKKQFQF
ncbi:1-aminocyclopropane-1-carboxylate deaminase/D-cysteine desulfhydrase [Mucilaginibacter arboris]|uniref:Pyridoxal-phosphate dependent enzyme n=1 Tax=Mucilaginibacter arboris TaxID=2682090 RepID=A0A7K1SUE5_9SPHI|nr:pyridoxal-phosphate dependent enzyme [Mucilaginibacter arboris]MVN20883.1 pyridoxal-phosphate dependent enzyme [Mucilaginibacter arboris]